MKQGGRSSGTYDLGGAVQLMAANPNIAEELARGNASSLSRVMIGSTTSIKLKPLSMAAKQFLMPDLAECFKPGVPPIDQYWVATRVARKNPYAVLGQMVLPTFYDSEAELEEWWARYEAAVSRLQDLNLDPKIAFEGADLGGAATFGLAYAGKDVRPVMQRLASIFHGYAKRAYPHLTRPIEETRRPGKFRLGYVSRKLIYNNGSRWALGWLTEHSPEIETFAFNLHENEDHVSSRWRRNVDHYYHFPIPLIEAAEKIRALDLDALIFTDVGSDGTSLQLSVLRVARMQMAAWGFPMTTGSPEMDFYISSEDMEPPNGQDHYTERLLRLPGSGQTFPKARPTAPSVKTAEKLGLPSNGFLLIAQNPIKLLPRRDAIFREIAERTGKPIVLCNSAEGNVGELVGARMKRNKVNVQVAPFLGRADFYRLIELADVVLDSFDFGGGITTVDTLTLRQPLVTCRGEFMRGRMAVPYMKQAGISGLIAENEREYIELACDPGRIRQETQYYDPEPMYRDTRPVRVLDDFLLGSNREL